MKKALEILLMVSVMTCGAMIANGEVVWVEDSSGARIPIQAPAGRVISVYGLSTYYFYALGAGDRVVLGGYIGVKTLAQAPAALLEIEPRLAEKMTFGSPSLEMIAALEPDLVVVDATRHAEFAELGEQIGLPILRQQLETPLAVPEALAKLAELFGDEARGRASEYRDVFDRIVRLADRAAGSLGEEDRVRVLFLGSEPQRVASGDMLQTEMIALSGGLSVSADLRGSWNDVDLEQILVWNPDVIVIPSYASFGVVDLLQDPDWAALRAVEQGRVYKMPRVMGPWDTAVPDFILGVLWLCERFYPDTAAIDLAAEVRAFYETFYAYTPSSEQLDQLIQTPE
ncbi:ABC transporter substrate-binding protein [Candidatus Bipolaricaulota bacterium]|nr:ABC transporter substrate-binding protein [Candidatus Bipolaricaulota bacterium]